MEKNFYRDNFEQLLRDTTDNFRMYPSNRVWHSIYNNLHPSRRWPSVAVWLLFIFSVIFIGLSNNNGTNYQNAGKNYTIANLVPAKISNQNPVNKPAALTSEPTTYPKQDILNDLSRKDAKKSNTQHNPFDIQLAEQASQSANIISYYKKQANKSSNSLVPENKLAAEKDTENISGDVAINKQRTNNITNSNLNNLDLNISELKNNLSANIKSAEKTDEESLNKAIAFDVINDKEWIEDHAFHYKPTASKWKSKTSFQFYVTPSIGYRSISKNNSYSIPANTSFISNTTIPEQQYESAVSQAPAVNMELGGNILYSITKILNLKIGVQLNYTNYNINAYELKHPTMTTLLLNDLNTELPVLSPRTTTLANTTGVYSTKLNNNTYQVSIPVGADIKIAGNNNLKWFAGATIQPTYIAKGNAYFISSDLKNYVTDNTLMRKWNLNGGVETFISYKTKSGLTLNAGPQLRYQLLSTYSKKYSYNEKLYNVGLKIGIISRF